MNGKRFLFFILILGISFLYPICPISLQIPPNSYMPNVEIVIERQKYFLELDSGCCGDITLREEVLKKIQDKKKQGIIKTYDLKGIEYVHDEFVIPRLKIGNIEFGEAIIRRTS